MFTVGAKLARFIALGSMQTMSNVRRILVIAGSDSSGGAGLEADQKVIAAHGCYAMTATTALTAQNTQGVYGIHETPSGFVQQQIDACADDIGIDVVKTGMLASASTIRIVADALKRHNVPFAVVDPVMVSTSGARLLAENAINVLCEHLLPVTDLLTPNIPEAHLLLEECGKAAQDIRDLDDMKQLAKSVSELGPRNVLIKGGHIPLTKHHEAARTEAEKQLLVNVLYGEGTFTIFESEYQISRNTHGTGCSLASAIACNIASGLDLEQSIRVAGRYVEAGIRTSKTIGKGSGPINHFHSLNILPAPPGGFVEHLLERQDVAKVWQEFTHHDFVERMGDGTLPIDSFKYYMVQDYLYLIQFARANALAAYKAKTLDDIAASATIVLHINHETQLHISECRDLGLSLEDLTSSEEHQACTAYSRYILDIGQSDDWLALQMAMLPCLLGYMQIAERLSMQQDPKAPREANRYRQWIDNYVAEDYTEAVRKGCELVEKHVVKQSAERIDQLAKIFIHATKMECGFWEMGMGSP
ncbi:hypothetical protein MBLNU459_g2131t2 [Dothideomycetes sp. NU459]